jgi:cytochrome c-type biogenesis protein CcmE
MAIATYFANQEAYYTVDELVGNPARYPARGGHSVGGAPGTGAPGVARAAERVPAGPRMQVRGTVDDASVRREQDGLVMAFTLTGKDGALPVVYQGIVPDTFDLAEAVTVGGRLAEDGTFVADQLLVQCPSKYEAVPPGKAPPEALAPADR